MKKTILATALLAAFAAPLAVAQNKPEEKKPDNEVSFNLGVASDYRYRGISQSRLDPALQGGVDYTHNPSGLYAGTWASTIKWVKDAGGGNKNVEVDLYAGKKGDIGSGFSYDVGGLYYWYPDNNLPNSANTFEVYGKVNQILENSPAKDIEKNVRAMLTQAFAKLDLVTREEFEAQTLMIAQLKARVDALERLSAQQQAGQATDEPSPSI